MFKNQKNSFLFLILILSLFPSCIKYYELSNIEFHQGHDHDDEREALDGNKKGMTIYDEFMTQAIFDVLYLAESVRMAYVDLHCDKKGLDSFTKKRLQAREIELNKHWITFYVLADIRDKKHVALTDKNSAWSLFLRLKDNTDIAPLSIKEVELEPEYQRLFGPMFNSFKRSYEIKFPAKDLKNNNYLKNNEPFRLFVSSAYKESAFTFNEPEKIKVSKQKKKAPKKRKLVCKYCGSTVSREPSKKSRLNDTKPDSIEIETVCEYCEYVINREPAKSSRLGPVSYEKKKRIKKEKVKKVKKIKKRKILKDEDFYWI